MSDESLEYPDYRRLSRTGAEGRIMESKLRDAPKIFSPIILKVSVTLGKERNGVGLSSADMLDLAESALDLPEDRVIDVYGDERDSFEVALRESLVDGKSYSGQSFSSVVHDVSLSISGVIDTIADESTERRNALRSLLMSDALADAVYLTLPQAWLIPDPEFRPRLSILPLFPGSSWMQFFKTCWGNVQAATIVFGQDGAGNVGLVVQFKEVKAMRQCVLSLFDRYLVHPKEGFGMKMPRVRVVRYSSVAVKKQMPGTQQPGRSSAAAVVPGQQPRPINEVEQAMQSATAYSSSKEIPLSVSEAFQKILERVERLDRENQRLLSLLLDEQEQKAAEDEYISLDATSRERSPRRKGGVEIPTSGLPPWRQSK